MAKTTVAGLRQQIAALEARAARLAQEETNASVVKVRALMDSLGVTIEHLSAAVSKKVRTAKQAVVPKRVGTSKKSASAKRSGAGVARYRDPATGATWSGLGRAPAWIASAANREEFAVHKGSAAAETAFTKAKKEAELKKAAASKRPPRAATKAAAGAKRVAKPLKPAAKKAKVARAPAPAKRAVAKKAAPRKAVAKKAAVLASAVETGNPESSAPN